MEFFWEEVFLIFFWENFNEALANILESSFLFGFEMVWEDSGFFWNFFKLFDFQYLVHLTSLDISLYFSFLLVTT
ncbi:hypothetical protein EKG38_24735 [Shewanella canadensis]|uniref:Uncharacterized protein n=1 Tax=Shewanella canadensis TaxID=271096 RepID=A0A3S0K4K3_9GAMM|nr:hypothetical protein [Shewanella canadensis]RTR35482.1 hypothetical protein EKG38_24735 [Shewanella canadensis]